MSLAGHAGIGRFARFGSCLQNNHKRVDFSFSYYRTKEETSRHAESSGGSDPRALQWVVGQRGTSTYLVYLGIVHGPISRPL